MDLENKARWKYDIHKPARRSGGERDEIDRSVCYRCLAAYTHKAFIRTELGAQLNHSYHFDYTMARLTLSSRVELKTCEILMTLLRWSQKKA